jgi:hypothetical protein
MRLCDMILGPPFGWARLADWLEEATKWLGMEHVTQWEVDAELEALRSSATRVRDLVLERDDRPSSLMASLSSMAELLEDRIDVVAANEVHWGTRLVLPATLSHFP